MESYMFLGGCLGGWGKVWGAGSRIVCITPSKAQGDRGRPWGTRHFQPHVHIYWASIKCWLFQGSAGYTNKMRFSALTPDFTDEIW